MRRIITERRLRDDAKKYPQARPSLEHWKKLVLGHAWQNPAEMKAAFPDVDPVAVASGNTVYVFNIQRNEHRLVAAVHFNTGLVYVLRIMTHRVYSKGRWKDEL